MRVVSVVLGRYTLSYDFTDDAKAAAFHRDIEDAVIEGNGISIETPCGVLTAARGALQGCDLEDPEANLEARKAVAVARKSVDRLIDAAVDDSGNTLGIGRD